jgi:DnaJ family protein C protein 7
MKRIKLVEQLKTAGNDAFKQGKNEEAIAKYTEAMDADPENETMRTILFSNRAAAYVKVRLSPSFPLLPPFLR